MPPALEDYAPAPQQDFYQQDYEDPMNQPHQLQQDAPQPGEPSSHQRVIPTKSIANPSIEGIAALPIVRASIPWRPGQELPPEKSVDSQRVQQRGAALLSLRGNVAQTPCVQCAGGNGRFSQCIVLQPWFQGACCSCMFTSKGNKCSFRHQEIPTGGNNSSNPAILNGDDAPKQLRKRGRPLKSAQTDSTFNSSPLGNQSNSNYHKSPDMDAMLQAQLADEDTIHVEDRPAKMRKYTGNEYQDIDDDTKALLGHEPNHKQEREQLPAGHPAQDWKAAYSSRPNTGAANYYQQNALLNSIPRSSLSRPASSKEVNVNATPVIDLLPKTKQRHIYGLISGLQGGIDHLQKQLNMLKNSLGIDMDDDDEME